MMGKLKQLLAKVTQTFKAIPGSPQMSDRQASPAAASTSAIGGGGLKTVGVKLFIIFFVCIVFFVFVSGFISYSVSKGIIEDKIAGAAETTMILTSDKIDLMMQNFESVSVRLIADSEFQSQLSLIGSPSLTTYERMLHVDSIQGTLDETSFANDMFYSIHLIPLKESLPYLSTSRGNLGDFDYNSDWFQAIMEADGKTVWLPTQLNGYIGETTEPVFAMGRAMRGALLGSVEYVLLFEIKLEAINELVANAKMSDNSVVRILSQDGTIQYSPHSDELLTSTNIEFKTADGKNSNHFNTVDRNGEEVIAAYQHSPYMNWNVLSLSPTKDFIQETKQIQNWTYGIAAVAAILAVIIGYFLANFIGNPLRQLRDLMNEGARGNLSVRTTIKSQDEIGQVGASFNQMMEQIMLLVQQTNRSAQDVLDTAAELSNASKQTSVSAKEISIATEQIANGASTLAIDAERGNELTMQMGAKLKNVISSNVDMGDSASEVRTVSEQGTNFMNELITKTNVTEEMTRNMVEKVDKLKDSTSSIRKILDLLNGITKQTNILSLNATIEAARAGAAGKGFMVVADEIRKLADQSKESIDVVGEIVETIQAEIDETVGVLSEAYPIFKEQIFAVKETDQIFKQVQTHMGGFVSKLDEVTDSIQQLEQSQSVLSEAMSNVSAVSEESSATSEEVASLSSQQLTVSEDLVGLANKLETLSNALKESLARFHT